MWRAAQPRSKFLGIPLRQWAALLCLGVFLVGCGERPGVIVDEREERAYRRGESLLKEGRHEEALLQFQNVIDARTVAPESHLSAGLIYLEQLDDPISAIYHFNRYLAQDRGGPHAARVRALIDTCKKEFMRDLPGEPFADEVDRLDLYSRMKDIEEENLELRQQLAVLRQEKNEWEMRSVELELALQQQQQVLAETGQVAPIVVRRAPTQGGPTTRTNAGGPRTYTVRSGDTLMKISREVYGESGRWGEIYEANRDQLPNSNALRVGQTLRIP